MKKITRNILIISFFTLILTLSVSGVSAQAFTEGFDNIGTLAGSGWEMINHSSPAPSPAYDWEQGYPANANTINQFNAYSGADSAYISACFEAVGTQGTISDWLLTPQATLSNSDTLSFWTRTTSVGASIYPDRMQVRFSQVAGNNVGVSATDVGDFNDLMVDINPTLNTTDYPLVWTQYVLPVTGLSSPVTGRFAFRYFVNDGGINGANSFLIGIDEVNYIPNPTGISSPSSVQALDIYPNPATDYVTFRMELPVSSDAVVTISNNMGQIVSSGYMSKGTRTQILDVSNFSAGFYTVNVTDQMRTIYRSNFVK